MITETQTRFKTFEYTTGLTWREGRRGTLASEGKPQFDVASPPEFKGIPGVWTPEDLFVASINACQMTTFLALAQRAGIDLKAFESSARGRLTNPGDGYRFTDVEVRQRITVAPGTDAAATEQLVARAHDMCLVGKSVNCRITVVPDIMVEG